VYGSYEPALRTANAVTSTTCWVMPVRLLQSDAEQLTRWQKRFDHVLVDEYQDTNHAQYASSAARPRNKNVCVVGDDDPVHLRMAPARM